MSAWPWASSDATGKVIPAFVAALQAVEDVSRNKRAELDLKTGAKVRYGYADLDAVLEAVKPVLTAQGLAVTQPAASDGVHSVLMHSSGEWLSFPPLTVTAGQATPQAQGSAISYGRRYQMLALLNIATEDDDGTAAAKKTSPKRDSTSPRPTQNGAPYEPTDYVGDAQPAPTPAQTKKAMALFGEIGVHERTERLALTSAYLGRDVATWKDVTRSEAAVVIDKLEKVPPA